jgi:biopolymer transport protein ExbD
MSRRSAPEINAGSMADIAFLLLIFFLVATTMDIDTVISRRLPQKTDKINKPDEEFHARNVFEININRNNQMLIEKKEYVQLEDLKVKVLEFLDNGGGIGSNEVGNCTYCKGGPDNTVSSEMSDHPNKAIISLRTDRGTSYEMFVAVHDVLGQAYTELRNREAQRLYRVSYEDLIDQKFNDKDNVELDEKIKKIKDLFPEIISEVEPANN